jgi:leucyl-tRNA---protein transferase
MFASVHFPDTLAPEELDRYLARGWFRMGQSIFTTNFLSFKDNLYNAIWLRIDLRSFEIDATQLSLMKKNAAFKTEIKRASITEEKEALYAKYKEGIQFDASPSLQQLLFRNMNRSVFDTYEVNIYHKDELIACGFFDLGSKSAEGIVSVYDPAFKKYSLGKYLIYQKVNYCKMLRLNFFYPGYFVPGYSFFDYKLSIGKDSLEFLRYDTDQWLPIKNFSADDTPLRRMTHHLSELQRVLKNNEVSCTIFRYAYFDANLIPELKDAELFDYPIFLMFEDTTTSLPHIIVYNVRSEQFQLLQCESFWSSPSPNENDLYSKHLLKVQHELLSTSDVDTLQLKLKQIRFENSQL